MMMDSKYDIEEIKKHLRRPHQGVVVTNFYGKPESLPIYPDSELNKKEDFLEWTLERSEDVYKEAMELGFDGRCFFLIYTVDEDDLGEIDMLLTDLYFGNPEEQCIDVIPNETSF